MSRQDSKQIENVKVMLIKGDNGSSIESIEKTGTSGLVDTYTVTLTDGSKSTFNVINGSSIQSIAKTGTQGLVDTYTVTLTNGDTSTFTVTNGADGEDGVGIVSIEKTGTNGAVDTYTITLSNGQTSTFTVTNATGAVDASLDTNSTNAIQNKPVAEKFNAVDANIAGTENGATASQAYTVGQFLLKNNQLYKVTQAISAGATITVGTNISATNVGAELKSCFQSVSDGKTAIASALTDKGQSSTSNDTFAQMATKIGNLMAVPTATKAITANGNNIDVLNYAKVNVSVSSCLVVTSAPMDGYSDHACWITRDEYKGYTGVALIGGTSGSFYANGSMAGIGSTPFWFDYNSTTGYIGLTFATNQYGGIYFLSTQPRLSFVLYK